MLGAATTITAHVFVDGDPTPHVVALSALKLTPIDLVWATGGVDGVPPEIAARLLNAAGVAAGRIDVSRAAGGLGDVIEVATRVCLLLTGARAMDATYLLPPHVEPARGLNLDEFQQRTVTAERALAAAHRALTKAITHRADTR